MQATKKTILLFTLLITGALITTCVGALAPFGSFDIDTVSYKPTPPLATPASPQPGIWIDTHMKLSSPWGGTMKSKLPYDVAFDYTDNSKSFDKAEFTSVTITYDDGTVEPATKTVKLPLTVSSEIHEATNSISGGKIVKSKIQVISGRIADVITREEEFTLEVEGQFVKPDGTKVPFKIDQHYDMEREKGTRTALDIFRNI